jgi:hypothetical protein
MKHSIPFLACAVMALVVPLVVHAAAGVRIHQSWLPSDSSSGFRTVQLDVRNITSGDLQNVDLRPALPDQASLPKGVLQAGAIPAGQARIITGQIVLKPGKTPLVWSVDYDDASGHHVDVMPALPLGQ